MNTSDCTSAVHFSVVIFKYLNISDYCSWIDFHGGYFLYEDF
jgi:hypothetical protein